MALFSYIISRIRDRCVFLLLFIIVLNIKKKCEKLGKYCSIYFYMFKNTTSIYRFFVYFRLSIIIYNKLLDWENIDNEC